MKNFIAVLAFACAVLVGASVRAEVTLWEKWGIDPYASSISEACAKAPKAIQGFQHMPQDVKDNFKKILGDSCQEFMKESLAPGTRIQEMWSGNKGLLGMKEVPYIPVSHAPDKRKYRENSVFQAPIVFLWKFISKRDGKTYLLYLPWVCFNWAWGYDLPQPTSDMKCVTVEYFVEQGDEIRFAIFAKGRLPSSSCWQLCDGDKCSAPPTPCDTCDWRGPKSVIPVGFDPMHTGRYTASVQRQTLRFPQEVKDGFVILCDERKGKHSDSWIVPPTAWGKFGKNNIAIHVPYGEQDWPVWGVYGSKPKVPKEGEIIESTVWEK